MPAARTRLATAVAAAFACGVLPAATPLPVSNAAAPAAWATTLAATSAFDNLSAFPDGTAYASVGVVTTGLKNALPEQAPDLPLPDGSTGFFKSADYGQTWSPMAPPPQSTGAGTSNLYVRFASPLVGYATYGGHADLPADPTGRVSPTLCTTLSTTFRTTDGGTTWTPLCEPHRADGRGMYPSASPLAVGRDGRTVLLTGYEEGVSGKCKTDPDRGVVNFSTDAGAHWTRGLLPKGWFPSWSTRVLDSRTALVTAYKYTYDADCGAVGDSNGVFLTTDSGRTYKRVLTCATQPICTAVAFASRTTFLVGRTDGSTTITRDGGRTWRPGPTLYDSVNDAVSRDDPSRRWMFWVQSFSFSDPSHGYASTRGSGSWRTTDGGRTWTQERSHECTYHPWGIGENAAATAERAVTGGPMLFSARLPAAAGPLPCHPSTAQAPMTPVAPGALAARVGGLAVGLDATVARR